MIGVPEAHRHFGSTIGGEVLDVLHTLGVSPEKIGYFTLDNAENNDTAMEVIGAELGFDGRLRRGRCIGHTINLSAKALLFGKNANAFEQQLSGAEALSDTEYAQWRKKGPVGKLHNIVVDVRISHRLIYLFKEVQRDEINRAATLKLRSKKPLKLIIDNDTRWLSQLYMIRRALRLKTSIELLLIKYKAQWEDENRSKKTGQVTQAKLAKKPRILRDENQLTDKDWEVLYHLEAILTVFETVVKTLEGDGHIRRRKQGWTGSYGNIWDVVLGYELLLNTLEEYKQLAADFPDPEHFRIGINLAWDKLDEYYQRLDETPIYYTAMALHPAYRWDWFDETWAHKPSWVEKAKEMVADVWLSDYAHLEVRTSSSRGDDEPPAKRPRFFNPFEKNSRLPNSKPAYAAIIVGDEYQAWQTDREASDGDPSGNGFKESLKAASTALAPHIKSFEQLLTSISDEHRRLTIFERSLFSKKDELAKDLKKAQEALEDVEKTTATENKMLKDLEDVLNKYPRDNELRTFLDRRKKAIVEHQEVYTIVKSQLDNRSAGLSETENEIALVTKRLGQLEAARAEVVKEKEGVDKAAKRLIFMSRFMEPGWQATLDMLEQVLGDEALRTAFCVTTSLRVPHKSHQSA
ncbi:hypothetical protein Forpi1262_v014199 [Fusarium oxysporum f. sp. raphani]|nr:hypothetical protein Forpi1262_v014199 [Fusarium oxysporum f. sp. raphani]